MGLRRHNRDSRRDTPSRPAGQCRCGLEIEPPIGTVWWQPTWDHEPAPEVVEVVRHGEDPKLRRLVRVPGGWAESGALASREKSEARPMRWERIGECWAGVPHPVTIVQ